MKRDRPDGQARSRFFVAQDGGDDYTAAEDEWIKACARRKQARHLAFLSATDFLQVALELGYRKGGSDPGPEPTERPMTTPETPPPALDPTPLREGDSVAFARPTRAAGGRGFEPASERDCGPGDALRVLAAGERRLYLQAADGWRLWAERAALVLLDRPPTPHPDRRSDPVPETTRQPGPAGPDLGPLCDAYLKAMADYHDAPFETPEESAASAAMDEAEAALGRAAFDSPALAGPAPDAERTFLHADRFFVCTRQLHGDREYSGGYSVEVRELIDDPDFHDDPPQQSAAA